MVQNQHPSSGLSPLCPQYLFHPVKAPSMDFPIPSVEIDWERFAAKSPTALNSIESYLLKPEILLFFDTESSPIYRLIFDSTGVYVSGFLVDRVGRVLFVIQLLSEGISLKYVGV